jgi:hypothetical protein
MEIRASHETVQSWRELAKQLAIITAGVLIALAFDGVVSWIDHRLLVREAVGNLRREIADNSRELDKLFAELATERKNLEHADDLAQMLLDHKKIEHASLSLNFNGAELAGVRLLEDSAPPDPVQVQQWKAQIGLGGATLFIEEQMARQLQKRYQAALEGR